MKALSKIIVAVGLSGLLGACAYDPAIDGYYSSSNSYYGNGYQQSPGYGSRGHGYSNNDYPSYRQAPYGYSNRQQRPYCPEDDD